MLDNIDQRLLSLKACIAAIVDNLLEVINLIAIYKVRCSFLYFENYIGVVSRAQGTLFLYVGVS